MPSDKFQPIDPELRKARRIFEEDKDKEEEEEVDEAPTSPKLEERLEQLDAELMKNPRMIMVDQPDLEKLLATGETVVANVDLGTRDLVDNEVIILEDENLNKHLVQFVSRETIGDSKKGIKIKVRLLKPE